VDDKKLIRVLKALSDPNRFRMVQEVAAAGELSCGQIVERFHLSQPTVSHHLRVLKEAGLIEVARRRGTWTFYRLVPEAIEQLAFAIGGSPVPEGELVALDRAVAS